MIDFMRNWLLSMTAVAIILAAANNLIPDGSVKKVGKFTGGLLMLIVVLQPIKEVDYNVLAGSLAEYRLEAEIGYDVAKIDNQALLKKIIEEETSAYLQNEAESMGIICSAETTCKSDDDGNIYPHSLVIRGHLTSAEKNTLTALIERDLAVLKDNIRYEGVDET